MFLDTLKNPRKLWDTAFRTHIDAKCRHLLIALFFWEYGCAREELRITYESLHARLTALYGIPFDPKDFEEALRILEGSFVEISNNRIGFINPSLRDYLSDYLFDLELLTAMAPAACKIGWADALWRFGISKLSKAADTKRFALGFLPVAKDFEKIPTWRRVDDTNSSTVRWEFADTANADRISLLLEWWKATVDQRFAELALSVARTPEGGFSAWRDGVELVRLIEELSDSDCMRGFPYREDLIRLLGEGLAVLVGRAPADDLEKISAAVDDAGPAISSLITDAIERAVRAEFRDIEYRICDADSESTLEEHISILQKWAPRYAIAETMLVDAVSTVRSRIAAIAEETPQPQAPSFTDSAPVCDKFDDTDLNNLFAPLLGD